MSSRGRRGRRTKKSSLSTQPRTELSPMTADMQAGRICHCLRAILSNLYAALCNMLLHSLPGKSRRNQLQQRPQARNNELPGGTAAIYIPFSCCIYYIRYGHYYTLAYVTISVVAFPNLLE